MRCRACLSTGYTEAELLAHEKKTGHRTEDLADRSSPREFAPTPPPTFTTLSKEEQIAALKQLLTPDDARQMLAELAGTPPAKKGGA